MHIKYKVWNILKKARFIECSMYQRTRMSEWELFFSLSHLRSSSSSWSSTSLRASERGREEINRDKSTAAAAAATQLPWGWHHGGSFCMSLIMRFGANSWSENLNTKDAEVLMSRWENLPPAIGSRISRRFCETYGNGISIVTCVWFTTYHSKLHESSKSTTLKYRSLKFDWSWFDSENNGGKIRSNWATNVFLTLAQKGHNNLTNTIHVKIQEIVWK